MKKIIISLGLISLISATTSFAWGKSAVDTATCNEFWSTVIKKLKFTMDDIVEHAPSAEAGRQIVNKYRNEYLKAKCDLDSAKRAPKNCLRTNLKESVTQFDYEILLCGQQFK